jgi:hypothetical protein
MKIAAAALLLISSLGLSQTLRAPGHASRHASVGKKYGSVSSVNTPNTNALASELSKIEQQGAHAQMSSPGSRVTSPPAVPKATQPAQSKNKPMKFTPRGTQAGRNTQPH